MLWLVVAADSPGSHPRISSEERDYIGSATHATSAAGGGLQASLEVGLRDETLGAAGGGWREMIRSPALWGQIFVDFAANWFFYVVFTFLPQYGKPCNTSHV